MDFIYTILRNLRAALTGLSLRLKPAERALFRDFRIEDLEIRRARREDIPVLERFLTSGDFMKHRKRIEGQAGGEGDYLIAWHTIPAAHIYIIWNGSSEGPLGEREENEPLIEDFHVHPAARGKGIGGALLKEAESLVREKGYERVGVSVIVTNPPVEKMYKRAGFKDSGLGAFKSSRIFTGRDGVHREWSKRVKYLVKDLR